MNDIVGQKFGRLTVISYKCKIGETHKWNCICECGNERSVLVHSLLRGQTRSCGCLKTDLSRLAYTTHGRKPKNLYQTWSNIKQRCYNAGNSDFKHYGGRGIKVCDEWRNSYEAFRDFALENGYRENIEIDRYPNKDGNYEPGNVRFVPKLDNLRNTRRIKLNKARVFAIQFILKRGLKTRKELSEIYNVGYSGIQHAYNNRSWQDYPTLSTFVSS